MRFFALDWSPGTRRELKCYLYHLEMVLTHPTPPGLTELARVHLNISHGNLLLSKRCHMHKPATQPEALMNPRIAREAAITHGIQYCCILQARLEPSAML